MPSIFLPRLTSLIWALVGSGIWCFLRVTPLLRPLAGAILASPSQPQGQQARLGLGFSGDKWAVFAFWIFDDVGPNASYGSVRWRAVQVRNSPTILSKLFRGSALSTEPGV